MADREDLLIEIGTEELPPKALKSLAAAFREAIIRGVSQSGLTHGEVHVFATPRRLALQLEGVSTAQPDRVSERKGPALAAAFDDSGQPTRAADGFARSCGVAVSELDRMESPKGAWLCHRSVTPGQETPALVPDILRTALNALPIPRRMRWGDGESEFVRPVHWVVLLFGTRVIETEILGVLSGRVTRGHRFHSPQGFTLDRPGDYPGRLAEQGFVLAGFDDRRRSIARQVSDLGGDCGGEAVLPDALLDEVTALVEWPVAVAGTFEERFLSVPKEVLITTMQDNQKYFPVVDDAGRLLNSFIAVSNIESRDPAQVRAGNERVIRPRFSDAEFFWNQDRRIRLEDRRGDLAQVVFEERLGSLLEKSDRLVALAAAIADPNGPEAGPAARAAALAKCDLLTAMVGEFPSLQGVMGRYYALHDGEPEEVASALDEQYMPRHAGAPLPGTRAGQVLALADRLDTLVGIFAIGQRPTGVKDPYGLRRAALGILRILIEGGLDLDLRHLLVSAAEGYARIPGAPQYVDETLTYVLERLRGYYAEQGIRPDTVDAVLARDPTVPLDIDRRIRAVQEFRNRAEAESLAAANKRTANILRQTTVEEDLRPDPSLFVEKEERVLHQVLEEITDSVSSLFDAREYGPALTELARLRSPVDAYFDAVMVMDEDQRLRTNRVALLSHMRKLFLRVADLSRLQGTVQA